MRQRSNDKLAAAEERAAKLEKEAMEVKRIIAWRQINRDQHAQIIPLLRDLAPNIDLLVEHERGDVEALMYGWEIVTVFQEAGVKKIRQGANSLYGAFWGAYLAFAPNIEGERILGAFNSARVPFAAFCKDLSTHLPCNELAPNVYIFVGPKPPAV